MFALFFLRLGRSGVVMNERTLRSLKTTTEVPPYDISLVNTHPSIDEFCGPRCQSPPQIFLDYRGLLEGIFQLLHGRPGEQIRTGPQIPATPVAMAGVGRYTVMVTIEQPSQDLASALMAIHRSGGIFVNGRYVERMSSLGNSGLDGNYLALYPVPKFDMDLNIDREILENYGQGKIVDALSDFELPETNLGKLDFTHNLLLREAPDEVHIAWPITAQEDIDVPVDAYISPHGLVECFLGHRKPFYSVYDYNAHHGTSFTIWNLESYLLMLEKHNAGERTIVMAREDPAREMLALCYGRPGLVIRHDSRFMSLQESMEKILNTPGPCGTIVIVV